MGPGGSLLNAGAFALLLILLCFGGWGEGIAVRGLILLALDPAGRFCRRRCSAERWGSGPTSDW
ncbi:MAG: hypothetical protein ACLSHO_07555 [Dysosmobacter sp.]